MRIKFFFVTRLRGNAFCLTAKGWLDSHANSYNASKLNASFLFLGEGQPFVRSKVFPSPKTSSFPKDCLGQIAASLAICLRTPFIFFCHTASWLTPFV